jgi:hypothetical protein
VRVPAPHGFLATTTRDSGMDVLNLVGKVCVCWREVFPKPGGRLLREVPLLKVDHHAWEGAGAVRVEPSKKEIELLEVSSLFQTNDHRCDVQPFVAEVDVEAMVGLDVQGPANMSENLSGHGCRESHDGRVREQKVPDDVDLEPVRPKVVTPLRDAVSLVDYDMRDVLVEVRVLEDIPKLFVLEAHLRSSDENLMFEVTNVLYDGQARLIGMKTHILTSRISSECQVSLFTTTALKSIARKRSAFG